MRGALVGLVFLMQLAGSAAAAQAVPVRVAAAAILARLSTGAEITVVSEDGLAKNFNFTPSQSQELSRLLPLNAYVGKAGDRQDCMSSAPRRCTQLYATGVNSATEPWQVSITEGTVGICGSIEILLTLELVEGEPAVTSERVGETGSCQSARGAPSAPVTRRSEATLRERLALSIDLLTLVLQTRTRVLGATLAVDACSVYRSLYPRVKPDSLPGGLVAQLDTSRPNADGYCPGPFIGDRGGNRIFIDRVDVDGPAGPVIRIRVVDGNRVHRESYYLRLRDTGGWEVFESRLWGEYKILPK